MEEHAEFLSSLTPEEAHEFTHDLVLQAGMLAEMDADPPWRGRAEAQEEAERYGVRGPVSLFHADPLLPSSP